MLGIVWALVYVLVVIYYYLLLIRLVYDIVQSFAREWRPRGISLILASFVYRLTDPPIRWLRRKIPPLNLGGVSLDLGYFIVLLVVIVLRSVMIALLPAVL